MIRITSRNVDGVRVEHIFLNAEKMLEDILSEDPSMGDNEILLVVEDGHTVYSSLGLKPKSYEDSVRTMDLADWYAPY